MKKRITLLVVVLMIFSTGCSNGNTPAPDPFFGRMTIAPPSTYMGKTGSNTVMSQPIAATPVSPSAASSTQPWASPPAPDFRSTATTTPGSASETTTPGPGRAIHLSPSTIEDSLRTPSYTSNTTMPSTAWPNRTTTAASAPRTITVPPNLQAINGQPVREQSGISYRSANGTIPHYNDPRSSFGQAPDARFHSVSRSTTAPLWTPGQNTNSNPERVTTPGYGTTQPLTVTPGTVASSDALEKMLPPIRGYDKSQRTAADMSTRKRVACSAMTYRSQNTPTSSQFPGVEGRPYRFVNLASLPAVSRIASRPNDNIKRLNYETPADNRSDSSSTTRKGTRVQPVSFTPTIRYSHSDDYTTLRGELDYSQAHQYWKLRYIPFDDEKMDDYGGSVILRDTAKLSGFERGDFVEVRGRLLGGPEGDVAYKRSYEVQNIQSIK